MSGPFGSVSSIVKLRSSSTCELNVMIVTCSRAWKREKPPVSVVSVPVRFSIAVLRLSSRSPSIDPETSRTKIAEAGLRSSSR